MCGKSGLKWTDAYATIVTTRFESFFTSAESADWASQDRVLWVNPPFTKLEMSGKLVLSGLLRCVCLIPDWGQPWLSRILSMSQSRLYIPSGTPMFDLDQKWVPPIRWGCWLLLVPEGKRLRRCPRVGEFDGNCVLPWNQPKSDVQSLGRRRRERAKMVKQQLRLDQAECVKKPIDLEVAVPGPGLPQPV